MLLGVPETGQDEIPDFEIEAQPDLKVEALEDDEVN